ncbi:MAG: HDIG domain-containing protein, partial [Deltaproteobacteria bacterium]|nr:HDIG domain-containing protein [Deltaproteobacteria bacterium]
PLKMIAANCPQGSAAYEILVEHSSLVAQKALALARNLSYLNPDMDFIHEAAMLHDIGIIMTRTPELGCTGALPYICHGYLGRAILEKAGLARHGRVCERHVGVGITMEDIRSGKLPIPLRDMTPQTLEEQIICYADKFYSKNGHRHPVLEKSAEEIVFGLSPHGQDKVDRFLSWHRQFEAPPTPRSFQS